MTSPVSQNPKAGYAPNRSVYSITNKHSFTVDWQITRTASLNRVTADHLVRKRTNYC